MGTAVHCSSMIVTHSRFGRVGRVVCRDTGEQYAAKQVVLYSILHCTGEQVECARASQRSRVNTELELLAGIQVPSR